VLIEDDDNDVSLPSLSDVGVQQMDACNADSCEDAPALDDDDDSDDMDGRHTSKQHAYASAQRH